MIIERSVAVHNSKFHADDVVAVALLLYCDLIDLDKIYRSRDLLVINECEYVCDVGGELDFFRKKFDHHQSTYYGEKASAGIVLDFLYKSKYFSQSETSILLNAFIMGVDDHDIGKSIMIKGVCTFSKIIDSFMPFDKIASDEVLLEKFKDAVSFTVKYIKYLLEKNRYIQEYCDPITKDKMKSMSQIIVFDSAVDWVDSFFRFGGKNHPAKFVIFPDNNGNWVVRGVHKSLRSFDVRVYFPKEWGGLFYQDLEEKSGISGAIFCHKGLFLSVWSNKESAIQSAKLAITLHDSQLRS